MLRVVGHIALVATLIVASGEPVLAQDAATEHTLILHPDQPGPTIHRDLFGQFAEHLGEGIYGGIWVGRDSSIPNVRGIRTDVVEALRALKVPNVRWPGGCYAEEYHWRDGIGPEDQRPTTLNSSWGGVMEPNTFGTHEFMDFIDQIGSEAYLTVNVASGSVEEAADWLEYMTTVQPTTLGKERVANGHSAPYRIKYLGIGNESWGCGGAMTPETYVAQLRTYSQFVRNYNPAQNPPPAEAGGVRPERSPDAMQRVAVGPDATNTAYTEAVMSAWRGGPAWYWTFEALALHFYTWGGTPMRAPAVDFSERDYASFLKDTLRMDRIITTHSEIMDRYDPKKKVALAVDEWGAWLRPAPGTNPSFLEQENSLRDAILTALNFNIFARHADRVRVANIAQMVNVLQASIMTDGEKMLLTPTYYVHRMYVPFQDATLIPVEFDAGQYQNGSISLPQIDAIAARSTEGQVWIALANVDPSRGATVTADVSGLSVSAAVGEVLTGPAVNTGNTFEMPDSVVPRNLKVPAADGKLILSLPPGSVMVVRLEE